MTAVDHAELKRLAEGATPGPWIAETGTDTVWVGPPKEWAAKVARIICPVDVGPGYKTEFVEQQQANAAFIVAANPAVVLELLSEIEGLKAERRNIVSHATMGTTDGEGLSVNQVSVEITRLRNELYARTQAPDSWRPDRDAVARIIDPVAWASAGWDRNPERIVDSSLAKADAILALSPQTAESGK